MRIRVGLISGVVLSLAIGVPALAAQPASQGCLGATISAAAQLGRDYGQLVASVATDVRGVGEEVQLILAGEFPDEAFPNTCND
jgi:hypothetical protein